MSARRKRNLIDTVLSDSSSAVCVLDGDRRIRFFSRGLEQETGWPAEDVEGLVCEPATSSSATPLELLVSTFSPSQEVLAGIVVTVDAVLPCKNRSSLQTQLTLIPILDSDQQVSRVIVISHRPASSSTVQPSLSQKLHAEITALRLEFRKRFSEASYIGQCPEMRLAMKQAELLKNNRSGYCISGSSGTGRRHLAKLIHTAGEHSDQSFVALDCQLLLAENVLENLRRLQRLSTDEHSTAHQQTGTLLLVDADRCPGEVQQWLLENLATEAQDIRLAATSSVPLHGGMDDEWLMPEFCSLFSTIRIELPDLHNRDSDIRLLAQHFVEESHRRLNTSAESMTQETLAELEFYRWPGNVRELRNVVTEACQNSFGVNLEVEDLPFSFRAGLDAQSFQPASTETVQSLEDIMVRFETDVLRKTLDGCGGNKAEAARRLGMTRPRLYRRLKTLGMEEGEEE